MTGESRTTTDHDKIRQWAEKRDGKPSTVISTGDGGPGILRIDFEGYGGTETLEAVSWDDFFEKFEKEKLSFLYQETTSDGNISRFHKFVDRDSVKD